MAIMEWMRRWVRHPLAKRVSVTLTLLRHLFDLNAEVFKQLADTLLEKRELGRDDLIPILGLVVLPVGFPLPFGPFERFGDAWPRGEV